MSELECVYEGEIVESPWQYTESGTPVFVSDSYEEHVQEWLNKEEEGKKVLWETAAIAASFTGRHKGRDGDKALQRFRGEVGVGKSRIYQLVEAYKLRVALEKEEYTRVDSLVTVLSMKHFYVVADLVWGEGGRLV